MISHLIILTTFFVSIPSFAMEVKPKRHSRPSMSTWDSTFTKLLDNHKNIEVSQFLNLESCLLEPLWEANKSRMDQARLAKLIYTTIPLARHRLGCTKCLGNTFVHPIAASGNAELMDELLKIHEQNSNRSIDLVNIRGLDGSTPMHFAVGNGVRNDGIPAENGDLDSVITLLRHKANISLRDTKYNLTPFGHALLSRREAGKEIVEYLSIKCESAVKNDNSVFEYLGSDLDSLLPHPGMYPALEKYCQGYANFYGRLTGKKYDGPIKNDSDEE